MDFEDIRQMERLTERFERAARDYDDLQNEMAGHEVGRIARFLTEGSPKSADGKRRDKERRSIETQLQIMMADAAYRALFDETVQILHDAQSRIETVFARIDSLRIETEATIEALESRAARLPDGSLVFQDQDGTTRLANGQAVDAELAATILWRGDEPSYEDWAHKQNRAERLDELESQARTQQVTLGKMQARLDDPDDPPSTDALRRMQEEAERIASELEAALEADAPRKLIAPEVDKIGHEASVGLVVPTL